MPLTPKFSIDQNDEFVLVIINVPYIRISTAEIITDGHDFSFFCQPYLLKLTFPYEFHEDDERCKAVYDPNKDNGTLVAHLPKKNHGEHFPGLDLTTSLLQKRKEKEIMSTTADGIEVLNSMCFEEGDDDCDETGVHEKISVLNTSTVIYYGFNQKYSNVLANLRDELVDMIEIRDPDNIPVNCRRSQRILSENHRFDIERYLGDHFDGESDPIYLEAMSYKPFWVRQWDVYKEMEAEAKKRARTQAVSVDSVAECGEVSSGADSDAVNKKAPVLSAVSHKDQAFELIGGFSEAERDVMRNSLKQTEYLIAKGGAEEAALLYTLADILFAYCYDVRTTQGEDSNVESAANIARLSSALSWLEAFSSPGDSVSAVIKFSLRRSIILPYLRVWKLSRKVLTDVTKVLFLGRRAILKCLLQVRAAFEHTDTHYLLNKLYLNDLCVWIQGADNISDERLQSFAKDYNAAKTAVETAPRQGKEFMGLFLPELEDWALDSQQQLMDQVEEEDEDSSSEDDSSDSDSGSDSGSDSSGDDSDSDEEEEEATDEKEVEEVLSSGVQATLAAQAAAVADSVGDINSADSINKPLVANERAGASQSPDDAKASEFLKSVPPALRNYRDVHLISADLAYLDTTVPDALTSLLSGEKSAVSAKAVASLLTQSAKANSVGSSAKHTSHQSLSGLLSLPSASVESPSLSSEQQQQQQQLSQPLAVKRVLIEELPDKPDAAAAQSTKIQRSDDVTSVGQKLSEMSVL